jgi:CheY-like chemotaxis protein
MNRGVPIVLLIEHEPILSVTLARVLKDGGYSVIPARRAHDALETFVTHHMDIALVVADTECTTFAGPPLLGALNMIDPRVPVVALSPNAAITPCAEDYPNVAAMQTKPVEAADLLAHVQHALQSPVSRDRHSSPAPRETVVNHAWIAGAMPMPGERVFGYGGVPFSWPPTEDELDDIQVVDTQASHSPEHSHPPEVLPPSKPMRPSETMRPSEPPPIRLVVRQSEPRRRRLPFRRMERWHAVAATALGGLALTTLLEVRGVPVKRAGMADEAPAAAAARVLSARNHHVETMRLVPAKRVTSRIDARIDSDTRLVTASQADNRLKMAPSREAIRATRAIGLPRPATRVTSASVPRRGPSTPPAAALPLAVAASRPPASPAPSIEPAPTRDAAASTASTNVRGVGALPPVGRAREDERDIYQVLQQYERAYEQLDVDAAHAVWPSLNTRALARAFDGLKAQTLEFSHCRVAMASREATAICGGRASYVPRVGHQTARTEPREWTFRLRKVDEDWLIAKAEVR